jgi:hypothetical protein
MEIAPIPGIHPLSAVKAQQGDFQSPATFDIDASAKPGDGGGQRSSRKAAGAEEDGEEDLLLDDEIESGGDQLEEVPARQVDYFV